MTPERLSDEIRRSFEAMLTMTSAGQLLRGPRPSWTAAVKATMGNLPFLQTRWISRGT